MRASMAARCAIEASNEPVWGNPTGLKGMAALTAMVLKNGGQNAAALALLDAKPGDVVLEIGCGPGMGLRQALKQVGPNGFVAGVDRSGCAVHFAAHTVHHAVLKGRAAVMRAEAHHMPFREAMFDKAYAVNSFQFWPDPARALREVARVLAPNGRFVITQRASPEDRPTDFAGAAGGMERISRASALFKTQGWRIIDERCAKDGARLLAVSVLAERPQD